MSKTNKINHFNFKEPIYVFKYIYIGSFFLVGWIICLLIGLILKQYDIIYGWLINLIPFVLSCVLDVIFNQLIMDFGKGHVNKPLTIFYSIILFLIKYIAAFLGLIIALIINECTNVIVFSIITILCGILLSYVIAEILSYIHYHIYSLKRPKK